jgi:hypothetical protein
MAAYGKENELLGIFDGKETEEDLVEEGENGGVGTYAEREREDSDGSEAGSTGEGAEGVFEVAKCGVERGDGIHFHGYPLPRVWPNNCDYEFRAELFRRKQRAESVR